MSKIWFYRRGETQFGPYDASELKKLANDGTLRPSDLVARAGDGKWVAAASVKGLFAKAPSATASPPPLPSPASSGPERLKGDSRRGRGGMLNNGLAAASKTAARTKRTLVLALLALLGVAGGAGVFLPLALKQFAAVPFKKAPPLSESWKDFVDATFFDHYVSCSQPNKPVLLYAWDKRIPEKRSDGYGISVIHLLAISHRELENTNSVEFPIQGVLRGHYYIFPILGDREAEDGDVALYQQYNVDLRFVPRTFAQNMWALGPNDHEITQWSMKSATVQKVMSDGRVVSDSPESLSIGYEARIYDERFPALHYLFREASLGGYWPRYQTIAMACREVAALRWELEKEIDLPHSWREQFDFSNEAFENWRRILEKRLGEEIQKQVEIAKPLLAGLPKPREVEDRALRKAVFKARDKFEQLQAVAARLIAIINIGGKHLVRGYGRGEDFRNMPESGVVCEVLARVRPGSEATLGGKLGQDKEYRVIASIWQLALTDGRFWHYPPLTPPTPMLQAGRRDSSRQDERPAASYEVKYEVFSPGPISVKYRNGLGGWDEKKLVAKQDGSYVIEVTLSASETAQITAKALDRDAPISAWIYVNGTRVAVSSDNDGGGTVTASGSLQSLDSAGFSGESPEDTTTIERLTPQRARKLAEEWGKKSNTLSLSGLATLDAGTAEALAEFKGTYINLNGLTTLDAETARALAAFQGERGRQLRLDGLTTVDAATAKALAGFKGFALNLNGLTTLDAKAAEALAEFSGQALILGGLTTLSDETARALARRKVGWLSLSYLKTLSDEAAMAFAQCKGKLSLGGHSRVSLSDEAAAALLANPEIELPGNVER